MSPLSSVRGTGGSINDTAVKQNQNTLTHPKDHTKGEFTTITAGTGSWTVPDGVTKVCIVTVGAGGAGAGVLPYKGCGGGGGGGLSWGNNITVKPGASLPYSVGEGGEGDYSQTGEDGGDTWIKDAEGNYLVLAEGGEGGTSPWRGSGGAGGYTTGPHGSGVQGGNRGGHGSTPHSINWPAYHRSYGGGGGGAGGYEGYGGNGGYKHTGGPQGDQVDNPEDGLGGAGGGGTQGYGGGGVGLYGEGSSGEGGSSFPAGGKGGSLSSANTESAKNANEPGAGPELAVEEGGGEQGEYDQGGICGGGGAAGGNFFPPDPGAGDDGCDGGLRICWGCGVSFPDNADGHYPTPA